MQKMVVSTGLANLLSLTSVLAWADEPLPILQK